MVENLFAGDQWQIFTPELVVLLFALLAPIVATWDNERRSMQQFALYGLGGALLMTVGSLMRWNVDNLFGIQSLDLSLDYQALGGADGAFGQAFMVTESSQIFKLIFLAVAFLAVLGVGRPLSGKAADDYGEFFSLILFATLGMMVVASAQDLFVLFLGIETASFASYLLAGFRRDSNGAEAGLKYFVVGSIASGLGLYAISLIYGMTGTTHIASIGAGLAAGDFGIAATASVVFLLIAFGFKIASIPVHTWAPDVYAGAPVPLVAMLASASKAMGFVALFHVFLVGFGAVTDSWQMTVAVIAAVTMFVGNLVALQQQSIRRMLAYSSIAQAGYLLIALAVATPFAVGAGVFHLMVNAAMKLGAFLMIGGLLVVGIPDHMEGYKGLGKRTPFMAFALTLFLLSMAGIPPLGGFMSKFFLFSSAVDTGLTGAGWLVWLAVLAVINSAISLYYYLRVIRAMYVEEAVDPRPLRVGRGVTAAVFVCLVAVLAMGIAPDWFLEGGMKAAGSMLGVGP
jgi:proton-translocating NADH-quinone oxidoreductase chain N